VLLYFSPLRFEREYAGERRLLHLPKTDSVAVLLSVLRFREYALKRPLHLSKTNSVAVLLSVLHLEGKHAGGRLALHLPPSESVVAPLHPMPRERARWRESRAALALELQCCCTPIYSTPGERAHC